MGIVRNLVKQKEEKGKNDNLYSSYKNIILYGETGKSSISASLSEKTGKPVLFLSPAGGTEKLSEEFPNIISYPLNDIHEYHKILDDIIADFKAIRGLTQVILEDDKERLEKAKKHYGNDWEDYYNMAKTGTFPISAIVVEEASTISNWVQDKLDTDLEINYTGEEKSRNGIDWNLLKREIVETFSKALRLPVTTIIATGMRLPNEKQKLQRIEPDISSGAGQRIIIDLVGNVFYSYKENGKYNIRLVGNKDVYCKDKLLPVKTNIKLEETIDVTNNPIKFWDYIDSLNTTKK